MNDRAVRTASYERLAETGPVPSVASSATGPWRRGRARRMAAAGLTAPFWSLT